MGYNQTNHNSAINRNSTSSIWKVALLALSLPILVYAFSPAPPSERTGGFGESTCIGCHLGTALNGGAGRVTITGAPTAYVSGTVYPITVRVEDPGADRRRWGFEMSARTQAGAQAGTLSPTNNQTALVPSFNGVQYIAHTGPGTRAGTAAGVNFTFNWTAPNTSAGSVVFHATGNAANNSGSENGDRIYSTSATVPAQVAGPVPTVADGATVNNGSFAQHPAPLGPGSIAAIFGANLNDGTALCSSSFGGDGKLITSLCGASVTVNNIAAPIFYATPGQLGIQIPFELAGSATANVTVTVAGQSSTPRTVFIDTAAPGIFSLSQTGSGPGAILIANSNILAVATGSVPGRTTRPARRGEIVTIFLTGLGVTSPALATGSPSTGNPTATPATVTIDALPATVLFSGTAPGFVGLNQINVTVPTAARIANDVPVVVTLGTKISNTVTMAVSQ
ncbi:MAG: hypothetical protein EXQ56_01950 [Acidobacteria bacterium]|nr:hypothetical protein [Acidobacteriota bacterium]